MRVQMFIKKWYIILICAVLCAAGMYYEKSRVNVVVPQTGEMLYIRVVKFNSIPLFEANQTTKEIDITKLNDSWSHMSGLEARIEKKFDIQKLNPKWNDIDDKQKRTWMGEHFRIEHIGPGMYELIMQFSDKEAKDAKYIKENSGELMDEYMESLSEITSLVTSNTKLRTIKEVNEINDGKVALKSTIEKKYAFVGFFLGGLVGIVIIMAYDARKRLVHH